jgi:hypothetical protein
MFIGWRLEKMCYWSESSRRTETRIAAERNECLSGVGEVDEDWLFLSGVDRSLAQLLNFCFERVIFSIWQLSAI